MKKERERWKCVLIVVFLFTLVPYETNEFPFEMYAEFNTWGDILGKHDFEVYGFHGPEPYVYEYLYNTKPTDSMENIGFRNVTEIAYSSFDAIFLAFKWFLIVFN